MRHHQSVCWLSTSVHCPHFELHFPSGYALLHVSPRYEGLGPESVVRSDAARGHGLNRRTRRASRHRGRWRAHSPGAGLRGELTARRNLLAAARPCGSLRHLDQIGSLTAPPARPFPTCRAGPRVRCGGHAVSGSPVIATKGAVKANTPVLAGRSDS